MSTPPNVVSRMVARGGARLLRSRRLTRAPIWLYRAGLGFLFGSRALMLEHTGRRSGTKRLVVLEVVDRPAPDLYLVASGFGTRAQWFRNIQADPHVRVTIAGHASAPATAHVLSQSEADTALAAYATRHPRAWAAFKGVLESTLGAPIDGRHTAPPMVGLRLE